MIDVSIPFTLMMLLYAYCGYKIIKLKHQGKKLTLRIFTSLIAPEFVLGYDIIKKGLVKYHH